MMMTPPQVVGVLLKKPGQHSNPRVPPLDPQETKIRGELYVEDLNERRIVSIRMGWLWVENTQMRLPLRALNLRQAAPGICQPHVLALGFTLTNSQGDLLATFWADTEPIYWSWVRAIAAELVRQTPFRAQRCLNFLEILTICPRGPLPLPESPTETRRRSRSELRCWLGTASLNNDRVCDSAAILDDSRRRARSELRGWSSSNSSDEDLHLVEYRGIQSAMLPKVEKTTERSRIWGCSESSEGSDDSLPWGGVGSRSSVDSIDSAASMPDPVDTREQRIQRYKEARRRENEARSRRVLEEDAKKRKARREENNNNNSGNVNNQTLSSRLNENVRVDDKSKEIIIEKAEETMKSTGHIEHDKRQDTNTPEPLTNVETAKPSIWTYDRTKAKMKNGGSNDDKSSKSPEVKTTIDPFVRAAETVDAITRRLPPLKVSLDTSQPIHRFKDSNGFDRQNGRNNNNNNNNNNVNNNLKNNNKTTCNNNKNSINRGASTRYKVESPPSPGVARTDSGERKSRARERRNVREKCQITMFNQPPSDDLKTTFLQDKKERFPSLASRIPILNDQVLRTSSNSRIMDKVPPINNKKEFFYVEKECREREALSLPRIITASSTTTTPTLSIHNGNSSSSSPCEEDVAKLLARCQRVDHYVPVREKLTLFESLSRLGGRLARSTEDLGRSASKPSPRGKQRARSLHDLNRAVRSVPVREMCRFFEGDKEPDTVSTGTTTIARLNESLSTSLGKNSTKDLPASILKNNHHHHHHLQDAPPCVRTSSRRKHYQK